MAQQQVKGAEECLQHFWQMFHQLEDMLEASQPDTHASIQNSMMELATKLRDSARIHNIAACRLEVAAHIYLIFNMMIPMM